MFCWSSPPNWSASALAEHLKGVLPHGGGTRLDRPMRRRPAWPKPGAWAMPGDDASDGQAMWALLFQDQLLIVVKMLFFSHSARCLTQKLFTLPGRAGVLIWLKHTKEIPLWKPFSTGGFSACSYPRPFSGTCRKRRRQKMRRRLRAGREVQTAGGFLRISYPPANSKTAHRKNGRKNKTGLNRQKTKEAGGRQGGQESFWQRAFLAPFNGLRCQRHWSEKRKNTE